MVSLTLFPSSRAELHFLHLDRVLFLSRFSSLPGRLVLVLPVVHHLHHGRPRVRCHLDQVQTPLRRAVAGLVDGNDADLLAVVGDEPYGADADLLVDANSFVADLNYLRLESCFGAVRHPGTNKKAREISGRNRERGESPAGLVRRHHATLTPTPRGPEGGDAGPAPHFSYCHRP